MRIFPALVSFSLAILVPSAPSWAQGAGATQKPTAPPRVTQKPTDESPRAEKQPEKLDVGKVADKAEDRIAAATEALTRAGLPGNVIGEAISVIQQLAASSRADQESVYLFVRQLQRNVDTLTLEPAKDANCSRSCREFIDKIHGITDKLLESSYTDDLVQNRNLSRQIKLRMPLLIEASLKLNDNVVPEEAAAAERTKQEEARKKQEEAQKKPEQDRKKQEEGQKKQEDAQKPAAAERKTPKEEGENAAAGKDLAEKPAAGKEVAEKGAAGKPAPDKAETKRVPTEAEKKAAENRRRDFERDLQLLSDRYINSKRFRLGVGLSYSYIPRVDYSGGAAIDLTPFQTTVTNTNAYTLLTYDAPFAGATSPGVLLSTKIPYSKLEATFSNLHRTFAFATPVRTRSIDPSTNVLTRSTVSSKLRLEYDVSMKAQLIEILRRLKGPSLGTTRFEIGVGGGLSGFRVDDSISTEVKAPIGGKSFNDLPAGTIINTSGDTSFNSFFWDTDFSLRISDEFELDLKGKFYNSKTSGLKTITVKGGTLSISAVWFPTFF